MNWFLKLLGSRGREYRATDFFVRIEPVMREVVAVIHTRQGRSLRLNGERIGSKWEGIQVVIPQEVEASELPNIVNDLKAAFERMRYGYVIFRKTGSDLVPETERQAAIAELREMGYEIEVLPDRSIRQTWRADMTRQDPETIRKTGPRMMALLESVHGTRQRLEVLGKSKDF